MWRNAMENTMQEVIPTEKSIWMTQGIWIMGNQSYEREEMPH